MLNNVINDLLLDTHKQIQGGSVMRKYEFALSLHMSVDKMSMF
jgi:hypothetical protein